MAAVVFAAAGPAFAGEVETYPPSFFAESQPYSALDMIRRLPGFTLDGGDDEVRGLAGAGGNVLIDGERPTTKEDLETLLARLPATDVLRIELIRGGTPGIDMQGRQVIANVVRRREAAVSWQAEGGVRVYEDGGLAPQLQLQRTERRGDRLLEGSLRLYRTPDDETGDGFRRRLSADGATLRDALYSEAARTDGAAFKAGGEGPAASGRLSANLALDRELTTAEALERRIAPVPSLAVQEERETLAAGEIGVSFDRRLPLGELSLTGLQRLRRTSERERILGDEEERFESHADSSETVLAATLSRRLDHGLEARFGAEGAYNVLTSRAALEEDGAPVDLPGARAEIREARGEASVSATWRPAAPWTLEAGMRVEASRLRHSGGTNLSKSLVYAKPRGSLIREFAGGRELRLRLEREVGQLDFEDFAASASLLSGVVTTGNADLEPETSWVAEVSFEQRFWTSGAVVLSYEASRIDNVLDRIPLQGAEETFDAPGNIGHGRRHELGLSFTLPLSRLGIAGGLLTGEVAWVRSSVRDPTTGVRRRISGDEPVEGELHFTQDLPRWRLRWGVDLVLPETEWEYRFDQVERVRTGAWATGFAEYAPSPRLRVRLEAGNPGRRAIERLRSLHDGPRDEALLESLEHRRLRFGPYVGVTLRRTL